MLFPVSCKGTIGGAKAPLTLQLFVRESLTSELGGLDPPRSWQGPFFFGHTRAPTRVFFLVAQQLEPDPQAHRRLCLPPQSGGSSGLPGGDVPSGHLCRSSAVVGLEHPGGWEGPSSDLG